MADHRFFNDHGSLITRSQRFRYPPSPQYDISLIHHHRLPRRNTVLGFIELNRDRTVIVNRDHRRGRRMPVPDLDLRFEAFP
jgi:hypothetical protein